MRCKSIMTGALLLAWLVALAPATAQAQDEVEKLYKTKCQACHAADGSGSTPMGKKAGARDFRSPETQKLTDAEMLDIVTKGKEKMPAYKGKIADDDIKKLVGYVRELGKKK